MNKFKSPNEFSQYIEQNAIENNMSCMDYVLKYCDDNMLEPSDIAPMINKSLKSKIEQNFRDLNYLPKQAQLEI